MSLASLCCARWLYHCGANSAALSSYACTKPSMMSFAASRFSATDAHLVGAAPFEDALLHSGGRVVFDLG